MSKRLGAEIESFLQTSEAPETALQLIEVGLDAGLAEGVLRDVPILGTMVGLARIGITISDRILMGKLRDFLIGLSSLSQKERLEMVNKLSNQKVYAEKTGERIIELLNRVESERKPKMIAACFKAFATSRIDFGLLLKLNHAIEKLPSYYVGEVRRFLSEATNGSHSNDSEVGQAMTACGMATSLSAYDGIVFEANQVCKTFIELGLDSA